MPATLLLPTEVLTTLRNIQDLTADIEMENAYAAHARGDEHGWLEFYKRAKVAILARDAIDRELFNRSK